MIGFGAFRVRYVETPAAGQDPAERPSPIARAVARQPELVTLPQAGAVLYEARRSE